MSNLEVDRFYRHYHDQIEAKRERSPYWTRRFAYEGIQARMARHVRIGDRVLDAGCGEGSLVLRFAASKVRVVGVDLSEPNVEQASKRAADLDRATFCVANVVSLPFPDSSFDVVTCSHVLEHLPEPLPALHELRRVTRGIVVIAMPTCLTPAAWLLLGGATYWESSWRSVASLFLGLWKTSVALLTGRDGPQEGYAGDRELPHVWWFPWRMTALIRSAGLEIADIEGGPPVVPYLGERFRTVRSLQERLDRAMRVWPLRYLGYGTHIVARPL